MRPTVLPSLPIEILLRIISISAEPFHSSDWKLQGTPLESKKLKASRKKLQRLSLVCREFQIDAQRQLYHSICINSYARLEEFNGIALERPRLSSYVQKLIIDLDISLFHTAKDFMITSGYGRQEVTAGQVLKFDTVSAQHVTRSLDALYTCLESVAFNLTHLSIATSDSTTSISPIGVTGTGLEVDIAKLNNLTCDSSILWTDSFSRSVGESLKILCVKGSIIEGAYGGSLVNLKRFFSRAGKNIKTLDLPDSEYADISPFIESMPSLHNLLLDKISDQVPDCDSLPSSLVVLGVNTDDNILPALQNSNHIKHLVIRNLSMMETIFLLPHELESLTINLCPFDFLFVLEMIIPYQAKFKRLRLGKGILNMHGVEERCKELGIQIERLSA